jgi:hypothetical protein
MQLLINVLIPSMIFSGKKIDGNAEVDETAVGDLKEGVVGMEASICKNNYTYLLKSITNRTRLMFNS